MLDEMGLKEINDILLDVSHSAIALGLIGAVNFDLITHLQTSRRAERPSA